MQLHNPSQNVRRLIRFWVASTQDGAFPRESRTDGTHLWETTVFCFKHCVITLHFSLPDFGKEDCSCLDTSAQNTPGGKKAEKSTTVIFSYLKFHLHLPDRRFLLAGSKCLSAEKIEKVQAPRCSRFRWPLARSSGDELKVRWQMWEWEDAVTAGLCLRCVCARAIYRISRKRPHPQPKYLRWSSCVEVKALFASIHPGLHLFHTMSHK